MSTYRWADALKEHRADAQEAAAVLARIRMGEEQTYSLADVITELGLDPSDL